MTCAECHEIIKLLTSSFIPSFSFDAYNNLERRGLVMLKLSNFAVKSDNTILFLIRAMKTACYIKRQFHSDSFDLATKKKYLKHTIKIREAVENSNQIVGSYFVNTKKLVLWQDFRDLIYACCITIINAYSDMILEICDNAKSEFSQKVSDKFNSDCCCGYRDYISDYNTLSIKSKVVSLNSMLQKKNVKIVSSKDSDLYKLMLFGRCDVVLKCENLKVVFKLLFTYMKLTFSGYVTRRHEAFGNNLIII